MTSENPPEKESRLTKDVRAYAQFKKEHGENQSIATTWLQSQKDGLILVSTVIKGSLHETNTGFSRIFETRIFGGNPEQTTYPFTTIMDRNQSLQKAIQEHCLIIKTVTDQYLDPDFSES